jgi:transcriptional regulator of arginine metabolism
MIARAPRRERIRELLANGPVASQEQLQSMLEGEGIAVTQATLSRDLHDLGAVKGPGGYRLPGEAQHAPAIVGAAEAPARRPEGRGRTGALARGLAAELVSARAAGNLLILRTPPGHANALAIEIDRASLEPVVGTIAGDDTIFLAVRSPAAARRTRQLFLRLAGRA